MIVKKLNEDGKYWPIEVAEEEVAGYLEQGYLMGTQEWFDKRETELEAPEVVEVVEEIVAEEAPVEAEEVPEKTEQPAPEMASTEIL